MKLFLMLLLLLVIGCRIPVNCDDAEKSYEYWAGDSPPKEIKVLHGQYWRSPHFTLEYSLYLHLRSSEIWWDALIAENSFVPDSSLWAIPADAPKWFNPSSHCKQWGDVDGFSESRLYQDTLSGDCYIYFNQL